MKMTIKKNLLCACILSVSVMLFAQAQESDQKKEQDQKIFSDIKTTSEIIPTSELLAGYLERDSDLKNLMLNLQKEQISSQITKLDSGFDISLSTGNMTFKFNNGEEGNTLFSVSPKVEASLPGRMNLKASVSGKVNAGAKNTSSTTTETESNEPQSESNQIEKSEKKESSDEDIVSNISLKLSADIISSSGLKKEINLLKAERSIIEAERNLKTKVLDKETSFYTDYKNLLSSISSIIAKEKTYYDDKIDFEKIKAQGYTKTSSTYRRAEMNVLSDEHEIEVKKRTLVSDYKIFYIKCGYRLTIDDETDFMKLVPSDIVEVEALNIHDYDPKNYTSTEKAEWTNKINTMTRESNKNFTLSASGGYTFKSDNAKDVDGKKHDTVDVGLEASYGGLAITAETNIPLMENPSPTLTLSVGVNPNTFKKNKLEKQKEELNEKQEKLDISSAKKDLGTKAQKKDMELADIYWERTKNNENLAMYETLENDMLKWYNQGVITESEYLSAKVNRQQASVNKIINLIDMIMYNSEIKTMFVE
ncbi:MAG: TolC family protein [Treponema sp.]|nr:TolC family protein [Treponema sp.]